MKILLAVSGGIDSMYMACRALDGTLFEGRNEFAAAHCNFSLRGDESDGDEAFVREWCSAHGLELYTRRFDTLAYASANAVSMEMAARDLRYSWFAEICRSDGFDALCVAHNACDNAETLLLNLLRGTGTRGLRGMSPDRTDSSGMRILRPLLSVSRDEITAYMSAHGYAWREDSTNAESVVKRNVLRNEVFPVLKRLNPAFIRTLGEDMERFAQADDIAEDYFASASASVLTPKGINLKALMALKHWKFVLWRLVGDCDLNAETFEKLASLLERWAAGPAGAVTISGKTFQSPTHEIRICRTTMLVRQKNR